MIKRFNFIKSIMVRKNRQIKDMRERLQAEESMNLILSAYIAILSSQRGSIAIPKKTVSDALGKYRVMARSEKDDYVIFVCENGERGGKEQI